MADLMILEPVVARNGPTPASDGPGARSRTGAPARSFEDVLQELDRSGEPHRCQAENEAGQSCEHAPSEEVPGSAVAAGPGAGSRPETPPAWVAEGLAAVVFVPAPPVLGAAPAPPGQGASLSEGSNQPAEAALAPAEPTSPAPALPVAGAPLMPAAEPAAPAVAPAADGVPPTGGRPAGQAVGEGGRAPDPEAQPAPATANTAGVGEGTLRAPMEARGGGETSVPGEGSRPHPPVDEARPGDWSRPGGSAQTRDRAPQRGTADGGTALNPRPLPDGREGRAGASRSVPLERLLQEAKLVGSEATTARALHGGRARAAADPNGSPPNAGSVSPLPGAEVPPARGGASPGGVGPEGSPVGPGQAEVPQPSPREAAVPLRQGPVLASTPPADVGDLVVRRLQQLRSPGVDELRLELEPKELGSLKIRLELHGDGVKARFVVERPVVQAMLERAMAELRQNLTQQGYRVDELQVALQGDGQARRQAAEGGTGTIPARRRGGRAPERVLPDVEPPRRVTRAGPGRIDIWV